jgi:peptidoglycan/xylan/chitin deacetylase (PgdA/CDA1 family)
MYVILKFDDFKKLSAGFGRLVEISKEKDIKISFGVITSGAERNKELVKLHDSGLVEFWNHGSKHCRMDRLSFKEQLDLLLQAQLQGIEKIGIRFKTFGAPHNWLNLDTLTALQEIPEIEVLFMHVNPLAKFININVDKFLLLTAAHMMGCELTDFKRFKQSFNVINMEVLVLQAHPRNWSLNSFDEYLKILDFLKKNECKFVTPYEYYLIKKEKKQ